MVSSLYRYRSFIWRNALADLRHRYAGSGMGVVWNVLHPLAMVAVYSVVFSVVFKATEEGVPGPFGYPLFLCAGLFPWIAFSDSLTRGCGAFAANAAYLKKLPIPEPVFVAQTAVSATMSLLVSFALLIAVALIGGVSPHWSWAALLLPLILLQLVGYGLGLALGTLNVFLPDVTQIVNVVLQVAFWLTPIVYRAEHMPPVMRSVIAFHPATPAIGAVRGMFLHGQWPDAGPWLAMLGWAAGATIVGHLVLHALRTEIRDVL